jgi:hypothetical protein
MTKEKGAYNYFDIPCSIYNWTDNLFCQFIAKGAKRYAFPLQSASPLRPLRLSASL